MKSGAPLTKAFNHPLSSIVVLDACRMHQDRQDQPQRIGEEATIASLDLPLGVVAALVAYLQRCLSER